VAKLALIQQLDSVKGGTICAYINTKVTCTREGGVSVGFSLPTVLMDRSGNLVSIVCTGTINLGAQVQFAKKL
jgi:hypothetical protein